MNPAESLEEFYRVKFDAVPGNLRADSGHFNVFRLEEMLGKHTSNKRYSRHEFYKILLIRGHNLYHYADKSVEAKGPNLIFFDPRVAYTWEALDADQTGFFCIFREGFFSGKLRGGISDLPMFSNSNKPFYQLNDTQDLQVSAIYTKMLEEIGSDYPFKYDLLRNFVTELIHYALKMQPSEALYQHPNANSRITAIFTDLLERQFPIETPTQQFTLRTPRDFAERLSVHVNHLNRAIKATTGKTTTYLIGERIATEARALLKHTSWNVSEIGYCLGFQDPAHFNHFFKRRADISPAAYRKG